MANEHMKRYSTSLIIKNHFKPSKNSAFTWFKQIKPGFSQNKTQAHCFLVAEPKTDEGKRRMMVMVKSSDGFVIAEEDLLLRGAGEVLGTRQHGLPDLKIADLVHDIKILEQSKTLAAEILDIGLGEPQYNALRDKITQIYERKLLLQKEEM